MIYVFDDRSLVYCFNTPNEGVKIRERMFRLTSATESVNSHVNHDLDFRHKSR